MIINYLSAFKLLKYLELNNPNSTLLELTNIIFYFDIFQ